MKVYFIQGNPGGPIKIGISSNPRSRLDMLQTASPTRLRIVKTIRGDHALEAELHRRFAKDRLQGEWFNASPELLDYVKTPQRRRSIRETPAPEVPEVPPNYGHACSGCGSAWYIDNRHFDYVIAEMLAAGWDLDYLKREILAICYHCQCASVADRKRHLSSKEAHVGSTPTAGRGNVT